jgi:hypothetical protein
MMLLAIMVSVDVPDPEILVGDGKAVRPEGAEAVRATVPVNPF